MANTHKGRRFFVSDVPVGEDDLNQAAFEAVTWVEVGSLGMVGDIGASSNIINYDLLNQDVSQKQKGVTNAGDPTVEVAIDHDDPGQIIMRAGADTKFIYGFKVINDDAPSASFDGSIRYSRGIIASAVEVGGRVDDFQTETYALGLNQRAIRVAPAATVVPSATSPVPSITGTAVQTGVLLTAQEGGHTNSPTSYVYNWQHDTAGNNTFVDASPVGTSKTYTPLVGNVGNSWRVQVKGVNAAGTQAAFANSLRTGVQLA